jgi:methyl coenzyme M reductase system subunit A2
MDGDPHELCDEFVIRCNADYLKDFDELKKQMAGV